MLPNGIDSIINYQSPRLVSEKILWNRSLSEVPTIRLPLRIELSSAVEPDAKYCIVPYLLERGANGGELDKRLKRARFKVGFCFLIDFLSV